MDSNSWGRIGEAVAREHIYNKYTKQYGNGLRYSSPKKTTDMTFTQEGLLKAFCSKFFVGIPDYFCEVHIDGTIRYHFFEVKFNGALLRKTQKEWIERWKNNKIIHKITILRVKTKDSDIKVSEAEK